MRAYFTYDRVQGHLGADPRTERITAVKLTVVDPRVGESVEFVELPAHARNVKVAI